MNRNPALDDEEWPKYSRENPSYYIFNAEGDEKQTKEKLGNGPMASACAFWNNFLPRLRTWTGKFNFITLIHVQRTVLYDYGKSVPVHISSDFGTGFKYTSPFLCLYRCIALHISTLSF